jgi:hypothetical protein
MNSNIRGKNLAAIGTCLQAAPLAGLIATSMAVMKSFDKLGTSGIKDPSHVSIPIGDTLIWTLIGVGLGLVGVAFIFVSLIKFRYRAEWLFWFLVIDGVVSLIVFPIGTVVGISFLVYGIANRAQFLAKTTESS